MLCSHHSDWRFCDKSLFAHEYSLKRRGGCSAPRQNSSSHTTAAVGGTGIGLSSSKSIFDSQHIDKWGKYLNICYAFLLIYVKRIVIAKTEQILFLFFQQLLQQAIQTTPSIRPSQLQAQGGFFSGNILIIKATQYIAYILRLASNRVYILITF